MCSVAGRLLGLVVRLCYSYRRWHMYLTTQNMLYLDTKYKSLYLFFVWANQGAKCVIKHIYNHIHVPIYSYNAHV